MTDLLDPDEYDRFFERPEVRLTASELDTYRSYFPDEFPISNDQTITEESA